MRVKRSGSQILFGYLPEQTVDLNGRIWKVRRWEQPSTGSVDDESLRRELSRQAARWEMTQKDGGYVDDLRRGYAVDVLLLNFDRGVKVEPFPRLWICRACRRVGRDDQSGCRCGARSWGPLQFVGYHDCGALHAPYIPTCPAHHDAKIAFPGTASAAEITISCPECDRILQRGFGYRTCDCGDGPVRYTVHRAARVYTPRTVVIVNPPTRERVRALQAAGGPARALEWVVRGMETRSFEEVGLTRAALLGQLVSSGIDAGTAAIMADQAAQGGQLSAVESADSVSVSGPHRDAAEAEATVVAMALAESRTCISDLADAAPPGSELARLYTQKYERSMARSGLEAIELIDRFPVMTGCFGYTRGDSTPGEAMLVPFRHGAGRYAVHAEITETEAFFVRLDPVRVCRWLRVQGHDLPECGDATTARTEILRRATIPSPGSDDLGGTVGGDLLRLVHSYTHRLVRHVSLHAGIERSALSELLVPLHLGVFVYAAARGDFVLGGMQALFETELEALLGRMLDDEHRCALDPGCEKSGGACAACLHLGEPSCRWFNRYLDRRTLFGERGYLTFC